MAYASIGSTVVGSHPSIGFQPIAMGSTGFGNWVWSSTYLQAEIGASDFISDGQDIGLKVNDIIEHTGSSGVSVHRVTAVGATFTSLSLGNLSASAS
tara:strand:- start:245 stop:535 length:291 start_codon:yes stop_codon:yes gene_type:complete